MATYVTDNTQWKDVTWRHVAHGMLKVNKQVAMVVNSVSAPIQTKNQELPVVFIFVHILLKSSWQAVSLRGKIN